MKRFFLTLLILCTLSNTATANVDEDIIAPPEDMPSLNTVDTKFPGFKKFYSETKTTFVPIPVFATMPDEGQTYAVMPTVLITDPYAKAIKTIIAPQIGYNSIIESMGTVSVLLYPNNHTSWTLFAGAAQKFYQEYELDFHDERGFGGDFYLDGQLRFFRNPYGRFFGLGPTTQQIAKTLYTSTNYIVSATGGFNFAKQWRLSLTERYIHTNLDGPLNGRLPNMLGIYGPSEGVVNSNNLLQTLALGFNSAGFVETEIPFSKTVITGAFLASNKYLGSDDNYTGTDWVAIQTLSYGRKRLFSTVLRFHIRRIFGSDLPFYEQPSLGGPNELRGFTSGRFVDKGAGILQIEERIHVAHINFFKRAEGELSLDPFFEVGQVFNATSDITLNNMQPVGGFGVRLTIPPNVVTRVDVGFSRENNFQVFTTLNYPF